MIIPYLHFKKYSDYFDYEKKHYPFYFEEIKSIANTLGKFDRSKKIIITVPVHSTEKSVRSFLVNYGRQSMDKKDFLIIFFLNRSNDEPDFSHIKSEVKEMRVQLGLDIICFDKTFSKSVTMGYIRKFLVDTSLLYVNNKEVVIVNNDVDLVDLSPDYLKEILSIMRKNNESICYRLSDNYLSNNNSTSSKVLMLNHEIDCEYNKIIDQKIPIRAHTSNLSFSAETYTKLGGFFSNINVGEDLDFSCNASFYFGKKKIFQCKEKIVSSPRRTLEAYLSKVPMCYAWDSFSSKISEKIRGSSLSDLLEEVKNEDNERDQFSYLKKECEIYFNHVYRVRFLPFLRGLNLSKQREMAFFYTKGIFVKVLKKLGYSLQIKEGVDGYFEIDLILNNSLC